MNELENTLGNLERLIDEVEVVRPATFQMECGGGLVDVHETSAGRRLVLLGQARDAAEPLRPADPLTYPPPHLLDLGDSPSTRLANAIGCIETAKSELEAEDLMYELDSHLDTMAEQLDGAVEELEALGVLLTPIPLHKPATGREYFGQRSFSLLMLLVVVLWLASIFRSDATIDYLNTQVSITNATMELTRMKLRATSREVDQVEILCRKMINRGAKR